MDREISPVELAAQPGRALTERDTLVNFLGYFRSVLIRKAVGLDSARLNTTVGATSITLGGLVKHMAFVEDHWFHSILAGNDYPEPWASADWDASPDWEFDTASDDSPAELLAQFRTSVARSDAALTTAHDVDMIAARQSRGEPTNLRWIMVHMIEEYARHCGHADLIRESIDGTTGD